MNDLGSTSTSDSSPFGRRSGRREAVLLAGAFLVTLVVTLLLVRRRAPAADTVGSTGHGHGAGAMTSAAMPVQLGAPDQDRIGITFAAATIGPLGREVRAVALLNYAEPRLRTVALLVEGWVDRLEVDFTGQTVRAGDPLFRVYAPMVVSTEEELLLAKRLAADVAGGDPGAVRNAEDLVESARRRLRAWGIPQDEIDRLERSGEVQRTVSFRSPVSGVVIEKNVVAGQRLMPGDVAYRIADLGVVWLEGEVFEQDLAGIRPGLEVTAEFTALPGDLRHGRVTYVYPTIDAETRTAKVRVELPNPGLVLKPGMYATIRFTTPGRPTLTVPRSAVLSTGERSLVFLKGAEGRFTPREVTVGRASEDRVEILTGLARGDTVVASGTFLLDAESNLGSLLGGMGNMPGMDMGPPSGRAAPAPPRDTARRATTEMDMDMDMDMPMPAPAAPDGPAPAVDHSQMRHPA